MSNFQCPECGMINIDCGKGVFKTPRELELEKRVKDLEQKLNAQFAEMEEKLDKKEQECERLKWYLKEIRYDELKALDIEWDEYETHCIDSEYSNIINLVEEALKERSSEDCRYDR